MITLQKLAAASAAIAAATPPTPHTFTTLFLYEENVEVPTEALAGVIINVEPPTGSYGYVRNETGRFPELQHTARVFVLEKVADIDTYAKDIDPTSVLDGVLKTFMGAFAALGMYNVSSGTVGVETNVTSENLGGISCTISFTTSDYC